MSKPTVAELLVTNTKIAATAERLDARDKHFRTEFAKALGIYDQSDGYGRKGYALPEWEQVFCEVGKLLAIKTSGDIDIKLSDHLFRIETLEQSNKTETRKEY